MNKTPTLLLLSTALALAACGNAPQSATQGDPLAEQGQAAPAPTLTTLAPGKKQELNQKLKINVVFVGYEKGSGAQQVNEAAFRKELPGAYRTISRYPSFYGLPAELGINFQYDYNVVFADSAYEDQFFGYLNTQATAQPLSIFQKQYNKQSADLTKPDATNTARTISSTVGIDAPSTEKWLANNAPAGVDTTQYTVYLINWFGRPDFKDHFYTKLGEPDPDSGFDFGTRSSRKLIAWGGTAANDEETGQGQKPNARVWFHDLSAGPEAWTSNWDITNKDTDGNKATDYRLPPVWEYGTTKPTYRAFNDLSGDLGKVVRYGAINLLFTASPLYKPAISPPALPRDVQFDVTLYQGEAGFNAETILKPTLMTQELQELQPDTPFSTQVTSEPLSGRAADIYTCFLSGASCFGNSLDPSGFGDLFKYHQGTLTKTLEGDADYEVPIFAYHDGGDGAGLLGFADDNWADGTQSFVFGFDDPATREIYGLTTTLIHEVGHHLGMSHPHDGYDSETGVDYGGSDEFAYANVADEVNSMMSYIDLNWDFSQFDRDNMNRYLTSVYLNQANIILDRLAAARKAGAVSTQLRSADADATAALNAYATMNYAAAVTSAHRAYFKVLDAAAAAGVKIEPQAWQADYKAKGKSSKFVDSVNYIRSLP